MCVCVSVSLAVSPNDVHRHRCTRIVSTDKSFKKAHLGLEGGRASFGTPAATARVRAGNNGDASSAANQPANAS